MGVGAAAERAMLGRRQHRRCRATIPLDLAPAKGTSGTAEGMQPPFSGAQRQRWGGDGEGWRRGHGTGALT